ncbi:MAG: phage tail protein [Thermaceae bacterium]|nr:phage tail protein [Thermaceae bacterium]
MAVFRNQPYSSGRFVVDLGTGDEGFSEVQLPVFAELGTIYREGGDKNSAQHNLPLHPQFGLAVLRRGFQGRLELYQWWREIALGQVARRDVSIKLLDESASTVVVIWKLKSAWPSGYYFSPLLAGGCEVLIESLELTCDEVEME